jgi:predicted RNA binding protein YcfA (HicA-like mRNA interferase family)
MKKEIRKVIKEAEQSGWYLVRNKKHNVYKHVSKPGTVIVSKSTVNINSAKRIRNNFGL